MTWEIIREILSYAVTGLSTAIAGGTFIHFKTKRKTETQRARQEENNAGAGRFENLEREIQFLDKRLEKYRYDQIVAEKKMTGIQRTLTITIGQKRYAEQHICLNLPCGDRMPGLGEYTTEEPKIEKLNDLLDNMDITRLNELTDQDLHRLNKYLRAYKKLNEHK